MVLSSNQFLQNIEVGFCDRNTCGFNPIPVIIGNTVGVGEPVSLATNTVNTMVKVVPVSDTTIFGFTFIHAHKNSYIANDLTDILPLGSNSIIYLKTGSAISAGDLLAYDTTNKVINTVSDGEQIIGQALIGASASGDLIPVYLNQPVGKFTPEPEPMAEADLTEITELYRSNKKLYTDVVLETPFATVFDEETSDTFADSDNTLEIGSTTYVVITDENGHSVKAVIPGIEDTEQHQILLLEGEGSDQYLCYIESEGVVSSTNILVTDEEIE